MTSHDVITIIEIIILVILSGYFSATETAFTSVNRIKIKNLAGEGNHRARRVLDLSHRYDKVLSTILIGNNIVNITMTAVATVWFIHLFGNRGSTLSTIAITIVVLIFGEISPKTLAKENPESFSMFAAPLLKLLMVILKPLTFVFSRWQKLVLRLFKNDASPSITEDELITMVEEAETEGSLESNQRELIQNAIEFNERTAEEVMTPRVEIQAMEIEKNKEEVAQLFKATGFSRLPVYEDDLDKILGVLNQKDFHNYLHGNDQAMTDFVKPVVFVSGTIKIALLLKKLQTMKTQIAIVVDEYGGTEGLVTMEDIIEELVGEIYDEHDAIMSREVTQLANGSYRIMANASLAKVFDFFQEDDDQIGANTVNGWVTRCLDHLPQKGDVFEYIGENKNFKGRVTKATEKKALEINLEVTEKNPEQGTEK